MGLENTAAVVVHPHPSMGGDSSHPFVVEVASRLHALGAAVATPDVGDPDVRAAAASVASTAESLGERRVLLIGYSWGSVVTSHAAPLSLEARVLVAPPASMPLGEITTPTLVLVPENDQYGGPEAIRSALQGSAATLEVVFGADHFLWGSIDAIADRVVTWLTELV